MFSAYKSFKMTLVLDLQLIALESLHAEESKHIPKKRNTMNLFKILLSPADYRIYETYFKSFDHRHKTDKT